MTAAADRVFLNGTVHTLTEPDETYEAVAVRDGEIVRLGDTYEVGFLAGVDTDVVDLDGRVLLPGFVDAHTHMTIAGLSRVHADLSAAESPEDAVDRLRDRAAAVADEGADEWILGYGYDESTWSDDRYLTSADLDRVADDRPVVAFREDMHLASVNSVALDRLDDRLPADSAATRDGEPAGILREEAVEPVWAAVEPDLEETRELVRAALERAGAVGITAVHDMVRHSHAPRVYRELDAADELTARVRINYWSDHLDALVETGLPTNGGSEFVEVGAIKASADGSLGSRTAKLSTPYEDAPTETGRWVVDPDDLRALVAAATAEGFQFAAHAIGDEAIDAVLDAYDAIATGDPGETRHRVEHVELADDEAITRLVELDVVASVQPNFLKWAGDGGLYESRIGDRAATAIRLPALLEAGVPLAFGSDGMPLDPLVGVHWAVNAPNESQRLAVTDALRAYTRGGAYAGFDEDRLGTVEVGTAADLVVLERSPWDHPESIRDIAVWMTVVDGEVAYDAR